jgi:hypothetical protein
MHSNTENLNNQLINKMEKNQSQKKNKNNQINRCVKDGEGTQNLV